MKEKVISKSFIYKLKYIMKKLRLIEKDFI